MSQLIVAVSSGSTGVYTGKFVSNSRAFEKLLYSFQGLLYKIMIYTMKFNLQMLR